MNRRQTGRPRRVIFALAALLSLAACAPAPGGRTEAPPSPTAPFGAVVAANGGAPGPQTIPPIHTVSLGGYKTAYALPGKAGLVLVPQEPPGFAGIGSLAFYRYSTRSVETIATAPTFADGMPGGILNASFGGDWVAYVSDDARQQRWTLWAYNVTTRERVQVDSEASEKKGVLWGVSSWLTSATDLYWSLVTYENGHFTGTLRDFSFTSRRTATLYTNPALGVTPVAMNDTAILLIQGDADGQGSSLWLLRHGERAPTKISEQHGGNASMNARYAIWDDAHSQTTTLYDLATGKEIEDWNACIRPALDATRPYAVCFAFPSQTFLLAPTPTGQASTFAGGMGHLEGDGQIYDGRVFWIAPSQSEIDYFDLPA